MKPDLCIAGVIAVLLHAALLFGFHLETAATPLDASDTAVDVSLVADAPAAATAIEPATAPTEPPPEPPPTPPEPTPVPPPEPVPPPPTPVPDMPVPKPVPEPAQVKPPPPAAEHPSHHLPPRPVHPSVSASRSAGPAQEGHSAGPVGAASGGSGGPTIGVRARYNPKPPYPPEAQRLRQQGRVVLEVQVSAEGRATSVSVKHSSGFPVLDNAAVQGVEHWTFEPARVAGLPTAGRAEVPVNFSLSQ